MRRYLVLTLTLLATLAAAQTKSQKIPSTGSVIVQPSAPAQVKIDPGAFVVNQPKPAPPNPFLEIAKFLLPSLIALGASYYSATLSAKIVMKSLGKQLENNEALETKRQSYETKRRELSEEFSEKLQIAKQQAEDNAKRVYLQADQHKERAEALNLLLGRIHAYGKLGQEWHRSFAYYHPLEAVPGQVKAEVVESADRAFKNARSETRAFSAEVIAAAEQYGRVPKDVHENQASLSSAISAWTEAFEKLCANHRLTDDQIISDTKLMASDIRSVRDYELELRDSSLAQKEAPSFIQMQGEIQIRGIPVLSKYCG